MLEGEWRDTCTILMTIFSSQPYKFEKSLRVCFGFGLVLKGKTRELETKKLSPALLVVVEYSLGKQVT